MTKKLTILNIIILALIFIANIGSFYGINYPIKFDFTYHFSEYGFGFTLIVLVIFGIISYLISTLNIKNLNFKNKFLGIFALMNSIFLVFIAFQGISGFNIQKKEYTKIETEYINQAKEDIANDNVTFKYAGGLTIPSCDQKLKTKLTVLTKNTE